MPTHLESTAERIDLGMQQLKKLATDRHPYAGAIAKFLFDEGEALRDLLVFTSNGHEGITTVNIRGTQIFTQFVDSSDQPESSPIVEREFASSTH